MFLLPGIPWKMVMRIKAAEIPVAWIAIQPVKTILQREAVQKYIHRKKLPSQQMQKIADLVQRITSYYF